MTKNHKVLRTIEKNNPAWKRGLSLVQMKACAQLELAIRDDIEQCTTYRVWDCLYRLGLRPMPKNKQISTILNLSRGNPLAFLYFLMEAFYKSSTKDYSICEQLLMSAICQIDLPLTIYELDRLLPPGHLSREDQLQLKKNPVKKEQCQPTSHRKKPKNVTETKASPYFQKQPRPTITHKSFRATRKLYKANLPFKTGLANYNEKPRWFADYEFQPAKRVVKKIIGIELGKLYDKIDALQSSSSYMDKDGNYSNRRADDAYDSSMDDIALCAFHKEKKKIEKEKFLNDAKERCMKVLNLVDEQKENVRQLVTQQLEKDIDFYLKRHGKNWQSHWHFVPTIKDQNCSVCLQKVNVPHVSNLLNPHVRQFMGMNDELFRPFNVNRQINSNESEAQDIYRVGKIAGNSKRMENCKGTAKDNNKSIKPIKKQHKLRRSGFCSLKKVAVIKEFDMSTKTPICYCQTEDCKCSCNKIRQYFKTQKNQHHFPYYFDYENIFRNNELRDQDQRILEQAVSALYEQPTDKEEEDHEEKQEQEQAREEIHIDKITSFTNLNAFQRTNVISAIEHCVNNILYEGISTQTEKTGLLKAEQKSFSKSEHELQNFFNRDYFDPHDDKLMGSMLQAALKIISKDHRFVLATFPDCHKISSLIEWIKHRYGLKCRDLTYKEFNFVKQLFGILANMNNNFDPKLQLFLESKTMSYKYINEVRKWADCVKEKFFSAVDRAVLEQNRLLWESMHPYRYRNLSLRSTFFAYLPSDDRSIPHYNVWH